MPTTATDRFLSRASLRAFSWSARGLGGVGPLRRALVGAGERRLRAEAFRPEACVRNPPAVQADKLALALALLRVIERVLAERRVSDASWRGLLDRLVYDVLIRRGDEAQKKAFVARHGASPPAFLTLSPGKTCNLRCVGCYANSGPTPEKLPWATFERIVREAHDLWAMRFFVISGGEPLAYKDEDKGILDMAERYPDCFFLFYTNGTLIDDKVARRLGELGNLSPGISVEGLREATDARRGQGVFAKVVAAMERLRREKVLYGLSVTATRDNADAVFSDEAVDFFFEKMGALYAWVFHYMPIGRAFTLDLMLTPEQRVRLYDRVWSLVRERRLLIADFWNCGTATNGCISGARPGGYLYIDWNGAINPCVFVPYSPTNIHDVYARGGTLDEVWDEPFFAAIRAWQRRYGYREDGEPCARCGNWMTPCLIRDHHEEFQRLVQDYRPQPADDDARAALADPGYHEGLVRFGRKLAELTDPVWETRYVASVAGPEGAVPPTSAAPEPSPTRSR